MKSGTLAVALVRQQVVLVQRTSIFLAQQNKIK